MSQKNTGGKGQIFNTKKLIPLRSFLMTFTCININLLAGEIAVFASSSGLNCCKKIFLKCSF